MGSSTSGSVMEQVSSVYSDDYCEMMNLKDITWVRDNRLYMEGEGRGNKLVVDEATRNYVKLGILKTMPVVLVSQG